MGSENWAEFHLSKRTLTGVSSSNDESANLAELRRGKMMLTEALPDENWCASHGEKNVDKAKSEEHNREISL